MEEEEFEELELSEDFFKDAMKAIEGHTMTVEEAINASKVENEELINNFSICYNALDGVLEHRKELLKAFKNWKLQLYYRKIRSIIFGSGLDDIIDDIINKINNTSEIVENEKELLDNIKGSLKKLLRLRSPLCNTSIIIILLMIGEKNQNLMLDVIDYIEVGNNLSKGIRYISNKHYDEKINTLDNQINQMTLKLGLK